MRTAPRPFFHSMLCTAGSTAVILLATMSMSPATTAAQSTGAQSTHAAPTDAAMSDTAGVEAAVSRARHALSGFLALWQSDPGTIDWVFLSKAGAFRTRGHAGLEPVMLPPNAPRANTAITLGSERLAMVLLPLPDDPLAQTRLLVHEGIHTLQPRLLPQPTNTEPMDGGDLLDRADGRAWLFLELRALSNALMQRGSARRLAANDALAFRAERDRHATPTERARLDALDVGEGLPEYTAWRLTGTSPELLATQMQVASRRTSSWVRSVAYSTGPAYGLLLDAIDAKNWQKQWRDGARMPDLLRIATGHDNSPASLEQRAMRYDGDEIIGAERERDAKRRRVIDSLRTQFVDAIVVRVYPPSMQVSFDPNGQTPVDDKGTVMRNFRWAATDGAELTAAGALVSPNWAYVQVPLGDAVIADGVVNMQREIRGDGWRLVLAAGWKVERKDRLIEVRGPSKMDEEHRSVQTSSAIRPAGMTSRMAECSLRSATVVSQ